MLTAKILNSDASLNNFQEIPAKRFIPGEQFTMVVRLFESDLGLRYVQPNTSLPTFKFNKIDDTTLEKTGGDLTIFPDDRSIISMVIEESESLDLASGNFTFELDILGDGSKIQKGVVQNGLSRVLSGGDC